MARTMGLFPEISGCPAVRRSGPSPSPPRAAAPSVPRAPWPPGSCGNPWEPPAPPRGTSAVRRLKEYGALTVRGPSLFAGVYPFGARLKGSHKETICWRGCHNRRLSQKGMGMIVHHAFCDTNSFPMTIFSLQREFPWCHRKLM